MEEMKDGSTVFLASVLVVFSGVVLHAHLDLRRWLFSLQCYPDRPGVHADASTRLVFKILDTDL